MQHYSISFRCFTYIFYLLIILYHMVLPVENLCNFPVWMNWKINWVLEAYVSLIFISFTWLCLTGTRSLAGRTTSAHVYFLKKSLWICGWPFCKVCTQSVCKEISFRVLFILSIGARWETNKQKKDLHKRETAVSVGHTVQFMFSFLCEWYHVLKGLSRPLLFCFCLHLDTW